MKMLRNIAKAPQFLVFADQALCSGTNFLLTIFLAQGLGIKGFGIFSSVMLAGYLMMSINNAVILQPFQVNVARVKSKASYMLALVYGEALLVMLLLILLKLLAFLLPPHLIYFQHFNYLLCFFAGFIINDFFRKLLLGLAEIKLTIFIDLIFTSLVLLLLFKTKLEVSDVLLYLGWANLIASLPGLHYVFRNGKYPQAWKSYLRTHLTEGKWLFSVAFLQWCSSNFFSLVAGIYLGVQALGVLRFVQSFFGVINVGLQVVENYFLPKISTFYYHNVGHAKRELFKLTLNGGVLMGLVLFFVFVFSDHIIVWLGGDTYQGYGFVVKAVAVLYFFIFLGYPIRMIIRILGLNNLFFYGYLISFCSSLLTFHFLLKSVGVFGAVIGLMVNQIVMILYWYYQLNKKQFSLWK